MDRPERKRLGPLHWLAARSRKSLLLLMLPPLLYAAGFGPACWLAAQREQKARPLMMIYRPIGAIICSERDSSAAEYLRFWMSVWVPSGCTCEIPGTGTTSYIAANR